MVPRRALAAALTLSLTLPLNGPGAAQDAAILTAGDMVALCTSTDPRDVRSCDVALIATMTLAAGRYCYRGHYSTDELRRLFVAGARQHEGQGRLRMPFVPAMVIGLAETFPCP